MTLSSLRSPALLALAVLLLTTRSLHMTHVPDASWAALFLAGFYLSGMWPFGLLLTEAVVIDYVATQHNGLSSHCLSIAYAMIIPAYALLYGAGRLAGHGAKAMTWRDAALVAACLIVGVSLCFALTDTAFYWLSGRYPNPDVAGWAAHFAKWYAHFLITPVVYCLLAFAIHALWARYARIQATSTASRH
jgi:hypothetical protein